MGFVLLTSILTCVITTDIISTGNYYTVLNPSTSGFLFWVGGIFYALNLTIQHVYGNLDTIRHENFFLPPLICLVFEVSRWVGFPL